MNAVTLLSSRLGGEGEYRPPRRRRRVQTDPLAPALRSIDQKGGGGGGSGQGQPKMARRPRRSEDGALGEKWPCLAWGKAARNQELHFGSPRRDCWVFLDERTKEGETISFSSFALIIRRMGSAKSRTQKTSFWPDS